MRPEGSPFSTMNWPYRPYTKVITDPITIYHLSLWAYIKLYEKTARLQTSQVLVEQRSLKFLQLHKFQLCSIMVLYFPMIFIGLPMVFPWFSPVLAQDTLGFTPKVDFNAGVVAAGEAQIESTVTGNTPETFIPDANVALRLGWTHGIHGFSTKKSGNGHGAESEKSWAPKKKSSSHGCLVT